MKIFISIMGHFTKNEFFWRRRLVELRTLWVRRSESFCDWESRKPSYCSAKGSNRGCGLEGVSVTCWHVAQHNAHIASYKFGARPNSLVQFSGSCTATPLTELTIRAPKPCTVGVPVLKCWCFGSCVGECRWLQINETISFREETFGKKANPISIQHISESFDARCGSTSIIFHKVVCVCVWWGGVGVVEAVAGIWIWFARWWERALFHFGNFKTCDHGALLACAFSSWTQLCILTKAHISRCFLLEIKKTQSSMGAQLQTLLFDW